MKIIHIIVKKPGKNILRLINEQKKDNDVEVIKIKEDETEYDDIIDKIVASDRVISWGNVHAYYLN